MTDATTSQGVVPRSVNRAERPWHRSVTLGRQRPNAKTPSVRTSFRAHVWLFDLFAGNFLAFGRLAFGALGLVSLLSPPLTAAASGVTGLPATYVAPAVPGVSFEQRIGESLPLDVLLRDETGAAVRFGDYFGQRPAVLVFGYSRCPQLCSVVANATVETLRTLRLTAGRDFSVLYVSIDPTDGSRELTAMKRRDVGRYGRSGVEPGWHYLGGATGELRRLTNAAGFHFTYDERSKLYAHASGFLVLTPSGRVSRYFLGVDFTAQDVAAALERAAKGKSGPSVYNLLLVCARGLGITGKYGRIIWVGLEIAVSLTVIAVFGGIGWMFYQERKGRAPAAGAATGGDAVAESRDRAGEDARAPGSGRTEGPR
jgi:protein SCO1